MSLSPGRKIGPYDVVAPLGAGGMGEVYRARDSRLDRDVAIKILPDSFAGDTERLARFEREARALAALNHPNIAAIYGIEIAAETGTRALVMELVEGDDLSAHIARGAMPLADVLPVARQIAEALETAHEQGIVHRDLKPANVKVRHDGTIKVLDFGLAKIWTHDAGSGTSAPSSSPTLTTGAPFGVGSGGPEHSRGATHDGMIIGTAAYMAPEQAKGKPVDKRADVWAFGVVLYEMLTGRRAFEGEDISTTLATVLMKDPDWTALPPDTPPALVALIRRCLQRDPRQRLRDIGEARWLLSNPGNLSGPPAADAAPSARTGSGRGLLAAAVAGTAVISVVATVLLSRPPPAPVIRGAIQLPRGTVYAIGPSTPMNLSVSPGGDMVAFVAMPMGGTGETSALYLRRWNEGEARSVADSQGAYMPFFSPDGQWVAFMDGTTLKKASVSGGAPRTLATGIANSWGGTWLSDGRIIYSNPSPNGDMLHEVADTGGEPRVVSRADRLDRDHSLPQALSGDELLITIWTGGVFSDGNVARLSLKTGAPGSVLVEGGSNAHVLESGHLVYARGAELFAMTFRNQGDQVGAPVKVQEGVLADLRYATTQFDVSPSGVLAYAPASDAGPSASVVWVTADGQPQTVFEDPYLDSARLSPDGHTVVFQGTQSNREKDLWSYDLVAGRRSRLTSSAGEEYAPVVSPDGRSVYFAAWAATSGLYRTPLAGGVAQSLAVTGETAVSPSSFSADGRWLAVERAGANRFDIGVIDLQAGSLAVQWLAETPFVERQPIFSPTAGLVAYVSNQLGQLDVWVAAFPGKEGQSALPVSREGGDNPFWAPDGRTLYFTAGTKLLAATIEPGDPLNVSAPKDVMVLQNLTMIGIAPDGRFLAVRREPPSVTRIEFVLNWAEELKQRVR